MWKKSHWKQTGGSQKDSYTTKVVRNIHTELGRKGRNQVGTCAPGRGHRRGGGLHRLGDPPWGVSGSKHILEVPQPGVQLWEDKSPELWVQALKKLRLHSLSAHTLAYSWNKVEDADWNCLGLWPVFRNHPTMRPSLSWAPVPTLLAPQNSSTLGWVLLWLRGVQLWGTELAWTWHSTWTWWGQILLVLVEAADWKWSGTLTGARSTTAHAPTHAECPLQPIFSSTDAGWGRGGETIRGNRANLDPSLRVSAPAT